MVEHHRRRNNKINRKRIALLERRRKHLESRPSGWESGQYDAAEIEALNWVLEIARQWIRDDPYWVFVPDESGEDGSWRHLGRPHWDPDAQGYYVQLSAHVARPASEEEIRELERGRERAPR